MSNKVLFEENQILYTRHAEGTIRSEMKFLPAPSSAITGVNYHKLLGIGDVTGNTAYGFGDPTKPTTGFMASFGRTVAASAAITDTALDVRVINKLTNTAENTIQGMYVKAVNYAGATVGALIGAFIEVVSNGTVTNGAIGIKIGASGTVLEQDLQFSNGQGFVALTTAITATSTDCTLPAGTIGVTSHSTGVGKLFMSNGSKWIYAVVAG